MDLLQMRQTDEDQFLHTLRRGQTYTYTDLYTNPDANTYSDSCAYTGTLDMS